MKIKFFLFSLLFLLFSVAQSQGTGQSGPSLMRSNGRIYVVVAVMLTIMAGLLFYLIRLDRKLSKLERNGGE